MYYKGWQKPFLFYLGKLIRDTGYDAPLLIRNRLYFWSVPPDMPGEPILEKKHNLNGNNQLPGLEVLMKVDPLLGQHIIFFLWFR
jgi:hypothetical protein